MSRQAVAPAPDASYDGLFPPDSVTWRVNGDPILWIAGLRALFLQATHPAAMAGVLQHSDFRADPWGRLFRTADYVGTVSFGSTEQVSAAGSRVRGLHDRVRGSDERSGVVYEARDPTLLLWVHCCEVESFLTTVRRAGGGVADADADRYYDEQRRAAAVVGLDPASVPGSTAEMAAYFAGMRPRLAVDDRTRRIARLILMPPMSWRTQFLTPARPAWAGAAALAFALQPRWARHLYGAPGLPTSDWVATLALRALRQAVHKAPERYREGPHLRAARARLAAVARSSSDDALPTD